MLRYGVTAGMAVLILSNQAFGQTWNPRSGWKDSYSVDGVCYCDSNGYDHGADRLTVDTPVGNLSVVQICSDIQSTLGEGSQTGRVLYNDLQCGNGPPNNAGDEDADACPGRVDIGPDGCQILGPKWDLAAVYGADTPSVSSGMDASASLNPGDADLAIDGNRNTRWTTSRPQQSGETFTLDLGENTQFNQVVLDSDASPNDGPASFNVAVSTNNRNYSVVASGNDGAAVTTINFPAQDARYVRITQTGSKTRYWWSIHEISVGTSSGSTDNGGSEALDRSNWVMYASSGASDVFNATDDASNTRWSTRQSQRPDQYFEIDLQQRQSFSSMVLDSTDNPDDYPRQYEVQVSNNGNDWNTVASGSGDNAVTVVAFAEQSARYIRILQTSSGVDFWWSIHEINIYE